MAQDEQIPKKFSFGRHLLGNDFPFVVRCIKEVFRDLE